MAEVAQSGMQAQTVAIPPRLPLVLTPENRDDETSKDAKLVNGYVERSAIKKDEYSLYKRPGLLTEQTKTGDGLGCYFWRGNLYTIFGTNIYKDGVDIGDVNAGNGVYRWSETLGGTPRLVLGNGTNAYTYDGTTFAAISDPDFPATFVKGWAYLDATTYVMDADANIYGSELNDPTSWDPTNVVTAQIEPDGGVALAKQLVYVIALKAWSTEVYYDAQQPTGTPLGKVEGAKGPWGCVSAETLQEIDDVLYWVATTRAGSLCVVKFEGLRSSPISTKAVDRLLEQGTYSTTGVFSWQLKFRGHSFYCVTVESLNITLVYDIKEGLWYQWADTDGNYMKLVASTYNSDRERLVQHRTNGLLYVMGDYTNDNGALFTVDMVTPLFDAGVRSRRKVLSALEFVADQTAGSVLQVRYNDHDYNPRKWSGFLEVDLGAQTPRLTGEGTFYKRAYNFQHRCNYPLRIQGIEMQLDIGSA